MQACLFLTSAACRVYNLAYVYIDVADNAPNTQRLVLDVAEIVDLQDPNNAGRNIKGPEPKSC